VTGLFLALVILLVLTGTGTSLMMLGVYAIYSAGKYLRNRE
jgi:hypothetical protein